MSFVETEARPFFELLGDHAPADARAAIWTQPDKRSRHLLASDIDSLVAYSRQQSDLGKEVYVTVVNHEQDFGTYNRGSRDDKTSGSVLWVDVDIKGPGHKEQNLPPDDHAAIALLKAVPLDPSFVVDTGGGIHGYWLFDKPATDVRVIEDLVQRLQSAIRTKGREHGWKVDPTADLARVLRVPGTQNLKIPGMPRPVKIIARRAARYAIAELDKCLPPGSVPAAKRAPRTSNYLARAASDPVLLDGIVREMGPELRKRAKELAKTDVVAAAQVRNLIAGDQIASAGRNDSLTSLTMRIVNWFPAVSTEALVRLFEPSVAKMRAAAPEDPDVGDVPGMIDRAKRKIEKEKSERAEDFRKQDAAHQEEQKRREEPLAAVLDLPQLARPAVYPDGRVKAAIEAQSRCAGQRLAPDDFMRAFGVKHPTSDKVWAFKMAHGQCGDYVEMNTASYNMWLPREIERLPRWLYDRTNYGGKEPTPKSDEQIAAEVTTVADAVGNEGGAVIGRTDIRTSYYDRERGQFVRAHCPPRDIPAEDSSELEEFLVVALPDETDRERFKDHLVALLDLRSPSAGVFVKGPPRSGKNMMFEGSARLYGVTGSTSGELFHANFNAWTNPIIHHEEKQVLDQYGRKISGAAHREALTRFRHVLNDKHARKSIVLGYTRHQFSSNGGREAMFDFEGETELEMRASAERIDSFEFTEDAVAWLDARGGKEFARRLVENDVIAKYIRYLGATRGIIHKGSRMLVEGRLVANMGVLMAQDRTAGRILHAICRHLARQKMMSKTAKSAAAAPAVYAGDGRLGVNADGLLESWSDLMPHERNNPPDVATIRTTLKRYSTGAESENIRINGRQHRYWMLKTADILAYAKQAGDWTVADLANVIGLDPKLWDQRQGPFNMPPFDCDPDIAPSVDHAADLREERKGPHPMPPIDRDPDIAPSVDHDADIIDTHDRPFANIARAKAR